MIDQIPEWGREAGNKEIIGRLGGRACLDELGEYVLIERASLTRRAESTLSTVVANVDAQGRARRDFEERCPAFDACGWWHTHVHLEPFYSSTDRQNQATWTDPRAIGLVLSTTLLGDGLKVFRGPDAEPLRMTRGSERLAELRVGLRQTKRAPPVWEQTPDRVTPAVVIEPIDGEARQVRPVALAWTSTAANLAICTACIAVLFATLAAYTRRDAPLLVRVIDAPLAVPPKAATEHQPAPPLFEIDPNILAGDSQREVEE